MHRPERGSEADQREGREGLKTPMFRDAYAQRRCIVPVDGFFEWRVIGAKGEAALRHRHEG